IPERRVELHAIVEQRLERLLEFLHEVGRALAPVYVVAEHDHHVERKAAAPDVHLPADVVLELLAGPVVADCCELERVGAIRYGEILRPETGRGHRGDEPGENDDAPHLRPPVGRRGNGSVPGDDVLTSASWRPSAIFWCSRPMKRSAIAGGEGGAGKPSAPRRAGRTPPAS